MELRDYQKEAVDTLFKYWEKSSKPCLLQLATGCLAKGTPVLMADYSTKNVEDLVPGDKVVSYDDTGIFVENEVDCVIRTEHKPKPMLELVYGEEKVTTTYDHPFYNGEGYYPLYQLVWGALEEGSRTQLKLLCEQYGQAFNNKAVWCKHSGSNEAVKGRGWLLSNDDRRPHSQDTQTIRYSSAEVSAGVKSNPVQIRKGKISVKVSEPYYTVSLRKAPYTYCIGREHHFIVHNSGKSVICAEIVKRTHAPTLILQPTKEILEQNYQKLLAAGATPKNLSICSASAGGWEIGGITLATIGTIYKHARMCQHFKTVIIDESDIVNVDSASGRYLTFLRQLPPTARIVGLTATPWRNFSRKRLGCDPEVFCRPLTRIATSGKKATAVFGTWFWGGGVIYRCDIPYLQKRGFLSPTVYYEAETDWSFLSNRPGRVDYDTREMTGWTEFEANTSRFHQAIAYCLKNNLKTIVFSPNIDVSFSLVDIIRSAGGEAFTLDSENDNKKTREAKMNWFREDGCKFLVNVGMVGRGVDVPSVDAVVLCRPTKSLSLYVQAIGRCLRIDPNNPNKIARILDLSGNLQRFGKVEDISLGKIEAMTQGGRMFKKDVIYISPNGKRKVWEKVS